MTVQTGSWYSIFFQLLAFWCRQGERVGHWRSRVTVYNWQEMPHWQLWGVNRVILLQTLHSNVLFRTNTVSMWLLGVGKISTGETCELKLVFCTQYEIGNCGPCRNIAKKQRRVEKMTADIERWRGEGNRPVTIEQTEYDLDVIRRLISDLRKQHLKGEGSRRRRKSS